MFLYPLRVNWYLTKLLIDPTKIQKGYRQSMQLIGANTGLKPAETALLIATDTPWRTRHTRDDLELIIKWFYKEKIDPRKADVQTSLYRINLLGTISRLYKDKYGQVLDISDDVYRTY